MGLPLPSNVRVGWLLKVDGFLHILMTQLGTQQSNIHPRFVKILSKGSKDESRGLRRPIDCLILENRHDGYGVPYRIFLKYVIATISQLRKKDRTNNPKTAKQKDNMQVPKKVTLGTQSKI